MDLKNINLNIDKFFQSKLFKGIICVIGILIVMLLILKIGMEIGFRKADFSYKWGENYHRNFGGPREGFMGPFGDRDFMDANGIFGQVIKIENQNITIKGRDNVEKVVIADEQTTIKRFKDTIKVADLKVDEFIVVIGEPNNAGQVQAKFIRVMPSPPTGMRAPLDNQNNI